MFAIQHYAYFITSIILFQIIPGAGTITILNATAREGYRTGMATVCGTLAGDLVYMLAALAGLAAVMHNHPLVFKALQYGGAAYLLWLGAQLLRSRPSKPDLRSPRQTLARRYFLKAFLVALTNPKVILFFVSFFPLFLLPDAPAATLLAMVLHVSLLSLGYQSGLVFVGGYVARHLSRWPGTRQAATRLAGLGLMGFGVRLGAGIE